MKTKKPKVSIIITYYNLGDYIEDAIESAINQTYKNKEIILINDGSTEKKSILKLNELKEKYKSKIKFIDQKNSGVATARNNAIKESKGKFICCLDGDDILKPQYIEKTSEILSKNKNLGFVTTWVKEFGERGKLWKTSNYNPILLLTENVVSAGSLFKKEIWEKVGGYPTLDKIFGYEDWAFWIKIISHNYKWEVIKKPLFLYRIRTGSKLSKSNQKRNKILKNIIKENLNFYKKNILEIIPSFDQKRIDDVLLERKNNQILSKTNMNQLKNNIDTKEEEINNEKNELTQKIKELELDIDISKETILNLQNDIQKILGTKGWKILEKLRSIQKKIKLKTGTIFQKNFLSYLTDRIKTINSKQNIKFTIGIPVYNHKEYLKECIESCLNQTYKNFEIIITDDHSSEEEILNIIKKYKKANPKIVKCIFNKKNKGITNTINEQILVSTGEYYVFLDCDDYLEKNALYEVYKSITLNNKPDYIFTDRKHVNENGELLFTVEYGGFKENLTSGMTLEEILPIGMATSHLKIIKKKIFSKIGLNSNYFSIPGKAGCQDYDFALRALFNKIKFHYLNKPLYNHRWHQHSVTFTNNLQQTELAELARELFKTRRYLSSIDTTFIKKKNIKKHILFIIPNLVIGGAEKWLLNLSKYLSQKEYKISIITTNGEGEWISKANKITKNVIIKDSRNTTSETIRRSIIEYIKDNSIDIVHISNSEIGYEVIKDINRLYPKPKIIDTIHSDKSGFIKFSNKYISFIDYRITVSNLAKDLMLKENLAYQNKIKTIYNATDLKIKNYKIKKENIITFVGRLSEEKNPQLFIDIANILSKKLPYFKFQIVGNGELFSQLKNKNNNKNIMFLGEINNPETIYEKTKYILITSKTEGLPLVLGEALSQKCVILSTPVGGIPEIIKDNQNGFLCSTKEDFIKTIQNLENDNSLYNKTINNGIDTVKNELSLQTFGEKYENIYKNVINNDNQITGIEYKLISICILTLNRYKALDNLLKSINKYPPTLPYEILILDQNSDDNTKKYLNNISSSKIKVFYSKINLGCSGGRKFLIDKAKGDYIVQLDNDLEVKEGWLEKLISAISWSSNIGGACGRVTFPNKITEYNGASYKIENGFITYFLDGNGKDINDSSLLVENYSQWLPGGATIFKKEVFKDENYDEKFLNGFEDNDLSLRLEKHGWKFVNCPSCIFIHNHRMFLSNEDLKKDKNYIKQRSDFSRIKLSFLRFYEKHKLIINNPELWKLMNYPQEKKKIEKILTSLK